MPEVTREEFNATTRKVEKLEEKVATLSERLIGSITELNVNVKNIEALLRSSIQSVGTCRAECDKRFDETEERVRKMELNWAKVLGIAAAVGVVFSVLTAVIGYFLD